MLDQMKLTILFNALICQFHTISIISNSNARLIYYIRVPYKSIYSQIMNKSSRRKNNQSLQTAGNQQQSMRKIEEEDSSYYQKNKLNLAFIGQNSKDIESISIAGSNSQRESISSISKIGSNSNQIAPNSPLWKFEPQISNMEEWSKETPDIFCKKVSNFADFKKRASRNSIPQSIEESNEEERQLQKISKCTKKRIGEKHKVITIQPRTFNQYGLRSKAKFSINGQDYNDSSCEDVQQIVDLMGEKKPVTKNIRKMLPQ